MTEDEYINVFNANYSESGLLQKLLTDTDFSDVTLVCVDNKQISVHRAVLAASSCFLRKLLYSSLQQSTFLYLGLVQYEVVQSLVQYIYLGHCNIHTDSLESLQSLAQQLGVEAFQSLDKDQTDEDIDSNEAIKQDDEELSGVTDDLSSFTYVIAESIEEMELTLSNNDSINIIKEFPQTEDVKILDVKPTTERYNRNMKEIKIMLPKITDTKPNKDGQFPCNVCPRVFPKKRKLKVHRLTIHEGFTYNCNVCDGQFNNRYKLTEHFISAHEGVILQCLSCEKVFNLKSRLEKHKGNEVKCDICEFIACNTRHLQQHSQTIHNPCFSDGIFKCDKCDYNCKTYRLMQSHSSRVHTSRTFSCDKCVHVTKTMDYLKAHQESKHMGITYPCDQCDLIATAKKTLQFHKRWRHQGVKYECKDCSYSGATSEQLGRHKRAKHDEIKWYCHQCDFVCQWQSTLKQHEKRIHKTEKYKCDQCNFVAGGRIPLSDHRGHLEPQSLINMAAGTQPSP